ncbi:MAG: RNA methyltransferase [Brevinematales bacterium]|nr:RNA methyltransferase [Brevinematales bacterium]
MFKIVLVETEGEENIGAIARIMMNFSFKELILVSPRCNHLSNNAVNYAVHAKKILENANIVENISEVLSNCKLSIAFTKRIGQFRRKDLTSYEIGSFLKGYENVALIFGNEKYGLKNEDIEKCDLICHIPSSEEFPSLNLSHSVGVICYEIYKNQIFSEKNENLATKEEIDSVLNSFISFLHYLDYFKNTKDTRLKNYLNKLLHRIKPEKGDIIILGNLIDRIQGIVKRISSKN